ncbi:hypothetical protein CYMTET_11715 [Cymbomonas tetramitiformis]|uniref:Uncharacterized protein n=1 Tax=Cymbomonas tetramitiformis TaxID=36881 RepID=A0AAE0LD73_9CHLO|nr:hypothetical protein CYMTET_11715 [Cymbomonas tetramitiformis]
MFLASSLPSTHKPVSRQRLPRITYKCTTVARTRAPPKHFTKFRVRKDILVPVKEKFGSQEGGSALEDWLQDPANVMGIVFSASAVTAQAANRWRVTAMETSLLSWELRPEFTLEVAPLLTKARPGEMRMEGYDLSLSRNPSRLPPGFESMGLYTDIDTTMFVLRRNLRNQAAVEVALDVCIAADISPLLMNIPGFELACESTISNAIDLVAAGAESRVQNAYDAWAARVQTI